MYALAVSRTSDTDVDPRPTPSRPLAPPQRTALRPSESLARSAQLQSAKWIDVEAPTVAGIISQKGSAVPPAPAPAPAQKPPATKQPAPAAARPSVTLGQARAASTPTAMAADRIPPRVDTPVAVAITGLAAGMAPVDVSVEGSGGANGEVTVDGATSASLHAPATSSCAAQSRRSPARPAS